MTRMIKTSNRTIKQATISRSIFAWLKTDASLKAIKQNGQPNSGLNAWLVTGFTDAEGYFLIK